MCLFLGTMALLLSRSPRQKVYYQDGLYLVNVRYGKWHDLREFVTPDDPAVLEVYSRIGPDAWQLFDFVCRNISYLSDIGEFWFTPTETLAQSQSDCEDTSLLLCSLLRNFTDAKVALGNYCGLGHAWVSEGGLIYETTYTRARPVPDPQDYCPYLYFDDREVIELWPDALAEVFGLDRDEAAKLNLIAQALRG